MKHTCLFIIICLMLLEACKTDDLPEGVTNNLELAGENKSELLKVIDHYSKKPEDSLKLEAAYFLIANMNNHFSYDNNRINLCYGAIQEEVLSNYQIKDNTSDVSRARIPHVKEIMKNDLKNINSELLIQQIDDAFRSWQLPWSRQYDFETFCEYILPYRVMHEPLRDNWRSVLYKKFDWVKDSLAEDSLNIGRATKLISDNIASEFIFIKNNKFSLPIADVPVLFQYQFGICEHRYTMVVAALRAMGIAATIDETPLWNRYAGGHQWTVYFDQQGNSHPFNGGEPLSKNDKNYFPEEHVIPTGSGNGTKIYRLKYSNNSNALVNKISDENIVYSYFKSGKKEDMTHLYKMPVTDINYWFKKSISDTSNKVIYLCAFDYGKEFKPVDWCLVQRQDTSVTYNFVGGGASTYVLAQQMKDNKLHPVSNPFQFAEDTLMEAFVPSDSIVDQIKLTRKFSASMKAREFAHNMVGAKFQGANDRAFKYPVTLYTVEHEPYRYYFREATLDNPEKFRYVRYISSDTGNINVAEIQFHTKEEDSYKLLRGEILKYINRDTLVSGFANFSDENIRTNFNAPAGSWIGYDFGKPYKINKVKFLFRNNFNIIEEGDVYELFYFDYGWKSSGKQKATDNYLIYENVPDSALFTLKNHSRGREERIFFYRWGMQHWL